MLKRQYTTQGVQANERSTHNPRDARGGVLPLSWLFTVLLPAIPLLSLTLYFARSHSPPHSLFPITPSLLSHPFPLIHCRAAVHGLWAAAIPSTYMDPCSSLHPLLLPALLISILFFCFHTLETSPSVLAKKNSSASRKWRTRALGPVLQGPTQHPLLVTTTTVKKEEHTGLGQRRENSAVPLHVVSIKKSLSQISISCCRSHDDLLTAVARLLVSLCVS